MKAFDFIIIGAGSAGCVLANRLSANPLLSVCLLEAGKKDSSPMIHIPFGLAVLSKFSSLNWNFATQAEKNLNSRSLFWPRGKVLGGSSSINAMCYIRGHAQNYDEWAKNGAKGWDWQSVLPYFRKSENNSRGISLLHGSNGPLSVSDLKYVNPTTLDFINAGVAVGEANNPDFNGISQAGVGLYQVTQKNGSRCSSAKAYLTDTVKKRDNLTIVTNANVKNIILENQVATGVLVDVNGNTQTLKANREVLVCAGALGSPQILMQSGIGPRHKLDKVNIPVKKDLAGVGENLQDHLDCTILYRQEDSQSYGLSVRGITKNILSPYWYWRHKRGMLTSNIAEGGAFIKSSPELSLPDIQIHFIPALLRDHGRKTTFGHGFTIHFCMLYPKSKGSIELTAQKDAYSLELKPNYLSDARDYKTLIAGFKWAQRVANSRPLSTASSPFIPAQRLSSDEEIIEYIKGHAETLYHPVGTCKMGTNADPDSVVDCELKVLGIEQLRVVDASVMPTIVGGNTNAPTIMIAEKAADIINKANCLS